MARHLGFKYSTLEPGVVRYFFCEPLYSSRLPESFIAFLSLVYDPSRDQIETGRPFPGGQWEAVSTKGLHNTLVIE